MKKRILGIGLSLFGILITVFSGLYLDSGGFSSNVSYRVADTLFWLGMVMAVIGLMIFVSKQKRDD